MKNILRARVLTLILGAFFSYSVSAFGSEVIWVVERADGLGVHILVNLGNQDYTIMTYNFGGNSPAGVEARKLQTAGSGWFGFARLNDLGTAAGQVAPEPNDNTLQIYFNEFLDSANRLSGFFIWRMWGEKWQFSDQFLLSIDENEGYEDHVLIPKLITVEAIKGDLDFKSFEYLREELNNLRGTLAQQQQVAVSVPMVGFPEEDLPSQFDLSHASSISIWVKEIKEDKQERLIFKRFDLKKSEIWSAQNIYDALSGQADEMTELVMNEKLDLVNITQKPSLNAASPYIVVKKSDLRCTAFFSTRPGQPSSIKSSNKIPDFLWQTLKNQKGQGPDPQN